MIFKYKEGGESFEGKNIIFSPPVLKVFPQTFRNIILTLFLSAPINKTFFMIVGVINLFSLIEASFAKIK